MPVIARHPEAGPPPRRRRRLRSISMLPSLFTLGNLLCGFAAIYFALRAVFDFGAGVDSSQALTLDSERIERMLPSFLSVGAGLVIVGLLCDAIDGMLARVTRSTTNFGGQLDSLADMVTAGLAPATLMVAFMINELKAEQIYLSPLSEHFFGRFAWVSAAVYVACAAVRLARFNVEHDSVGFDHRTFRGLPSPGAAAIMVALMIFQEQSQQVGLGIPAKAVVYAMPLVALAAGLLMVSRLPYRKLVTNLRGRRPFGQLVIIIFLFAIFWSHKALALLVVAAMYVLSGPFTFLLRNLRSTRGSGGKPKAAMDSSDQSQKVG